MGNVLAVYIIAREATISTGVVKSKANVITIARDHTDGAGQV